MIIHVCVTQDHIDKGEQGVSDACPVYLAIEHVCKDVVQVDTESIFFIDRNNPDIMGRVGINTPSEVEVFITAFDDSIDHPMIKPFEFDLDIPDSVKCN